MGKSFFAGMSTVAAKYFYEGNSVLKSAILIICFALLAWPPCGGGGIVKRIFWILKDAEDCKWYRKLPLKYKYQVPTVSRVVV